MLGTSKRRRIRGFVALNLILAALLAAPASAFQAVAARLRPEGISTIGDLVWCDTDQDGLPDPGEPGIDHVIVKLYLDDGDEKFQPGGVGYKDQQVTGDDPSTVVVEHGWYDFNIKLTNLLYWVVIGNSNFLPGGALYGYALTSKDEIGPTPLPIYLLDGVQDYNDADFGYGAVAVVAIAKSDAGDVQLEWPAMAGADTYQVWRSAQPYFAPGDASSPKPVQDATATNYTHIGAMTELSNTYYVVRAVTGGTPSINSSRTGKFAFSLTPGSQ